MEPLRDADIRWLAERIHEQRALLRNAPEWRSRILDMLGVLVWAPSVDGRDGDLIKKDGLVQAGGKLTSDHFENAPSTVEARANLRAGRLTAIKREHVVPRNVLRHILLRTSTVDDSVRVINSYALVALVSDDEARRILPKQDMPAGWIEGVDWSQTPLPQTLPDPWARYAQASPSPVVPINPDGSAAFILAEEQPRGHGEAGGPTAP